jgi:hypothetical protein
VSIPHNCENALLQRLLTRGDSISVRQGRLHIEPASGKPVCPKWFKQNCKALLSACCRTAGVDAFFYVDYSTGAYGPKHNYQGLTVNFVGLNGEKAHACFNASIHYERGPKKGKRKPGKQFTPKQRSIFVGFWQRCGLKVPERLGKFHDYMGHLHGIAFSGARRQERFDKATLGPATITETALRRVICPHTIRTTSAQLPHNSRTTFPHKDSAESPAVTSSQPNFTACNFYYENKNIREEDKRVNPSPNNKRPAEQSVEEWLEDYERRDFEIEEFESRETDEQERIDFWNHGKRRHTDD